MSVSLPKGYRKCAETYDQYKRATVQFYHNPDARLAYIVVDGEQKIGPLTAGQIEVMMHVLKDVLDMKTNIRYLE